MLQPSAFVLLEVELEGELEDSACAVQSGCDLSEGGAVNAALRIREDRVVHNLESFGTEGKVALFT